MAFLHGRGGKIKLCHVPVRFIQFETGFVIKGHQQVNGTDQNHHKNQPDHKGNIGVHWQFGG